jgi:hypothetical protein
MLADLTPCPLSTLYDLTPKSPLRLGEGTWIQEFLIRLLNLFYSTLFTLEKKWGIGDEHVIRYLTAMVTVRQVSIDTDKRNTI